MPALHKVAHERGWAYNECAQLNVVITERQL